MPQPESKQWNTHRSDEQQYLYEIWQAIKRLVGIINKGSVRPVIFYTTAGQQTYTPAELEGRNLSSLELTTVVWGQSILDLDSNNPQGQITNSGGFQFNTSVNGNYRTVLHLRGK